MIIGWALLIFGSTLFFVAIRAGQALARSKNREE